MRFMAFSSAPNWKASTAPPVLSSSCRRASKACQSFSTEGSATGTASRDLARCSSWKEARRAPEWLSLVPTSAASSWRWLVAAGSSSRTCSMRFSTVSVTKPLRQALDACLSWASSSRRPLTWSSARLATFWISTLRASGAWVRPRKRQSMGEVVALTTSVSAAMPLTRKSTRSPSSSLRRPRARSWRTRMARARPTMPRRPPQVMMMRSLRLTRSPARFSRGRRPRSITSRRTIITKYTRTVQR
mmetsp:Transcript_98735/g.308120  ORF Transcript_98735/g.308120 Transcript_98735/m.308120 type:complete len:245 (-) Transcript_98735:207-941(-)